MTANDMMTLRALLEKSSDADLLREMIGFTVERLMALGQRSPPGSCPGSLRSAPEPPWHAPRSAASDCRRLAAWADSCRSGATRGPT